MIGNLDSDEVLFHRCRQCLLDLKELLPDLLAKCQSVSKFQGKIFKDGDMSQSMMEKLDVAKKEREVLREYIVTKLSDCGDELRDARIIVSGCVNNERHIQGEPIPKAVKEFCRTCNSRRADYLLRLKQLRARKHELVMTRKLVVQDNAKEQMEGQELELRKLLLRLNKLLGRLHECDQHLSHVRSSGYIVRYEDERASAQSEKECLSRLLEKWCVDNRNTKLWDHHNELIGAIQAALDVDLDKELIDAIQSDIVKFAFDKNIFPKQVEEKHAEERRRKRRTHLSKKRRPHLLRTESESKTSREEMDHQRMSGLAFNITKIK